MRGLSKAHLANPYTFQIDDHTLSVGYVPGDSDSGMFGGNSNWRGPVWFPVNYLAIEALRRYDKCLGDDFTVELPTGSGTKVNLAEVAENLRRRLIALFLDDDQHRRPAFGPAAKFQHDPNWHNLHQFNEYFHGDTGAGLGASHQTGWTALVVNLILRRESGQPPRY